MADLWVTTLGELPYRDGIALQERLRDARQVDALPDCLLLLEHPPVYTRGRRAQVGDLPREEQWYRDQGIAVEDSDRGGQVTYHGPGQLVGYPIMRVRSVREYVETMERALITALRDEGIAAGVPEGLTGVWAGGAKIGSIGIHVSRGVTTHGFAVNVDNDLEPFGWVATCGVEGAEVTSVAREKEGAGQGAASMSCFRKRVAFRFAEAFGLRQRIVTPGRLLSAAEAAPAQRPPTAAGAGGAASAQPAPASAFAHSAA
ncbi:MAG TPA: lipoyl(octanoyl) transferase LipB [Thermoleophilaceae bacterium]|nr:lipoyl(octanoyl) transferase LipB [Thermoleophilaceae bacterium]